MKRQVIGWEKLFAKHVSDLRNIIHISGKYKELTKFSNKEKPAQYLKLDRTLKRHFSRDTPRENGHMERWPAHLAVRETSRRTPTARPCARGREQARCAEAGGRSGRHRHSVSLGVGVGSVTSPSETSLASSKAHQPHGPALPS